MGVQICVDGYIGERENGGVREVCQCLALALKAIKGDPVEAGGGGEGSWSREGRLQVIVHL